MLEMLERFGISPWTAAYLCCVLPAALLFAARLLGLGGDDGAGGMDEAGADAGDADPSGVRLSLAVVCHFFLGFGTGGLLTSECGVWSLAAAAGCGFVFVRLLAKLFMLLHGFAKSREESVPVPKPGDGCIAQTTLGPGRTGSVDVLMGGRGYGYFARCNEPVKAGERCTVVEVDGDTVAVAKVKE